LLGVGEGLHIHTLTTQDDISCVFLTNTAFNGVFAKKMMSSTILEFRDKFSFNPNLYLDKTEDTPEWDTSFHFD